MEITVREAARRLGVSEGRVRQILVAGDLRARRMGRAWLVDGDDVGRLQGQRRRPGRPLGSRRAWAALDILGGGRAVWLSASERSQVRSYLARLEQPDADEWRSILRGRCEVRPVRAHPAALARIGELDHVLPAGPGVAAQRGFDLVVVQELLPEFYMPLSAWEQAARRLTLQPSQDADIVIRHPLVIWPFDDSEIVPDAAIAADLLDSAEPRAVRAGRLRLNELLEDLKRRSG